MSVNSGNLPEARRGETMLGRITEDKVERQRQGADGEGCAAAGSTWAFLETKVAATARIRAEK